MHPIQAGSLDSAARASGLGRSGACGGQQPGGQVQPSAAPTCDGRPLCRCLQQSWGQEGPVARIGTTTDPELVDRRGAKSASAPAAPREAPADGGSGDGSGPVRFGLGSLEPVGRVSRRSRRGKTGPGKTQMPVGRCALPEIMGPITPTLPGLQKTRLGQHALTSSPTSESVFKTCSERAA